MGTNGLAQQGRMRNRLRIRPRRKRIGGRLVRVKNGASAANAKPKRVYITHAGGSRALLKDPLDLRSTIGRAHRQFCEELSAHVGGDLSVPQARLIDHASRLRLIATIAWGELWRRGMFDGKGTPRPALDAFRRAAADERSVLQLLGIERREKPVKTLQDLLEGKAGANADQD